MVDLTINGGSQTLDGTHIYDYVNITNGGILYVTPYNGTGTTGRLILNATEVNVDSTSSINGFARGYRGGTVTVCTLPQGGELQGYGGGSSGDYRGAGAGGYGTAGKNGGNSNEGAAGGPIQGTLDGSDIQMGNGGGAGGGQSGVCSGGSPGGAMLTINAHNINIHGTVNFNGGNGGDGTHRGGGASGGGILLNGTNIDLSSSTITTNGGLGGGGCCANHSYDNSGGGGRIKIFYSGTYNNSGSTISSGTTYVGFLVTPAHIEAMNMTITPNETPCRTGICTTLVSVTWKNTGGSEGSSNLSITVSGGSPTITPPSYSSVSFAVNEEVTQSFTVSNMAAGTHSICPNPN